MRNQNLYFGTVLGTSQPKTIKLVMVTVAGTKEPSRSWNIV